MKKFLLISLLLFTFTVLVVVLVFWYISAHTVTVEIPKTTLRPIGNEKSTSSSTDAASKPTADASSDMPTIPASGIKLSSLPLSDVQKKTLEAVGINVDTFVLTESMLQCGAKKIGIDRIEAMKSGEAPTLLETTKLVPCLGAS